MKSNMTYKMFVLTWILFASVECDLDGNGTRSYPSMNGTLVPVTELGDGLILNTSDPPVTLDFGNTGSTSTTTEDEDGVESANISDFGVSGDWTWPTGRVELTTGVTTEVPVLPLPDAKGSVWALVAVGVLISIAVILTIIYFTRHFNLKRRASDRRQLLTSVSQEGFFVGSQDQRFDHAL